MNDLEFQTWNLGEAKKKVEEKKSLGMKMKRIFVDRDGGWSTDAGSNSMRMDGKT